MIEHNLDVIKCADWIIDIGRKVAKKLANIVAQGTPWDVAKNKKLYSQVFKEKL